MKTFLFIGANSDIAIEARKKQETKGNRVISISRSENEEFNDFLIGDPVNNNFPELVENIDGLVYFPGSITLKPFRSIKVADFQSDFELNVLGAINSIQQYLSKLNEGSSIVLFSTVAVQTGMPFHSSVSVSKGAIEGLTRALAAEFAPKYRVNCIAPSLTQTKLAGRLLNSDEKIEAMAQKHPLKKIGSSKDLANALDFLLNDSSSWISGQILSVDGGMSTLKI
jgi:NAD(P)-dependent dehydrogenase (short-subunit alcohol dehydrogenase family)